MTWRKIVSIDGSVELNCTNSQTKYDSSQLKSEVHKHGNVLEIQTVQMDLMRRTVIRSRLVKTGSLDVLTVTVSSRPGNVTVTLTV